VSPHIIVREIAPGGNRPLNRPGTLSPDAEVYMDLEILASVAPHATLVVYFAENSSRGWIEAMQAAIFDRKHRVSVVSVSWGQAEMYWDAQTIAALEHLLQMAAVLGITVCCSSGDRGVFEASTHPYSVPYPASSPHVLACGGSRLEILTGARSRETVWNDARTSGVASGGGVSQLFGLPTFQEAHHVPARFGSAAKGRGIPDVSANASAATGYLIWADDTAMSLGGTSATAPLWAGLVACLNEALGRRIGYVTPLLYRTKRNPGLRNIYQGNNRLDGRNGYDARKTWDACTGLGSPRGIKLLGWLKRALDLRS
jgi:kumamolisin